MSVKTKLSCMISLIVFILLVLNVILNEYSLRVNLRSDIEAKMTHVSRQIAASVSQYAQSNALLESAIEDKLRAASVAAAKQLGGRVSDVTGEELAEAGNQDGVTSIALITREADGYMIKRSSNPLLIGQMVGDPPIHPDFSADRSSAGAMPYSFVSEPASADASGGSELMALSEKVSYYADRDHDYIIQCTIKDFLTRQFLELPLKYLTQTLDINSDLLEVSGFNPDKFGSVPVQGIPDYATAGQMLSVPIMFGSYEYAGKSDNEHVKEAAEGTAVFAYETVRNRPVVKSFVPVKGVGGGVYVIGLVMDKQRLMSVVDSQRTNQIFISGILLVIVVFCSYWLSDILIRPIRSILWKVNEVSFGRFDNSIEVKRKDELGQLAERVNAMSKNLGIYMTKLKHAFEENRSMKEYLESFINHTTDAIHVVDLEGRITQVNRAFEQLYGYKAEEVLGKQLPLAPEHLKVEELQTMEWLKSGKLLSARETERLTKSGEVISVSITTSPIRDKHGAIRGIASISRDMTSRNKMEELLRRSEKLTTVGQLAAGVAHEIRNPLTTLRGFLQLQQETNKLSPRHIDIMLSELDRINLIVGEFLILAKPQATRYEEKDVRFILGDVISLLDSQAHLCNIMFVTEFTDDSCCISCEENQLKQVFINVIKNAIEAMPQGGEIRLGVDLSESGVVLVSIADQGIGIPDEMIPKLGDPFFTGKETGTGLGLMVSQRIIQSHQGSIDIRSKVDEGTTVIITLPQTRTDTESDETEFAAG